MYSVRARHDDGPESRDCATVRLVSAPPPDLDASITPRVICALPILSRLRAGRTLSNWPAAFLDTENVMFSSASAASRADKITGSTPSASPDASTKRPNAQAHATASTEGAAPTSSRDSPPSSNAPAPPPGRATPMPIARPGSAERSIMRVRVAMTRPRTLGYGRPMSEPRSRHWTRIAFPSSCQRTRISSSAGGSPCRCWTRPPSDTIKEGRLPCWA